MTTQQDDKVIVTKELEGYFDKYSDVPREVIIKEDCLRHGLAFSSAALDITKNYWCKSYYLFQFDMANLQSIAGKESVMAPEEIRIHGGPYQLRPTVIANHLSTKSPYVVDVVEGKLCLCDRSEEGVLRQLAEVKLRNAPKYYSKKFPDGTLYSELVPVVQWGWMLFLTALRNCQYWGDKEECKFCDINANVREQKSVGRPYTVHKDPDKVAEVVAAIYEEYKDGLPSATDLYETVGELIPHALQISGGTVVNKIKGKDDTDFYLRYVEAIKEKMPGRYALILQAAAKDKKTCKKLKDAGVDAIVNNYEVWDKRLFQAICPGKENFVGYDEWMKRLCDAVEIFGESNVHPGFVAGVEMAQPLGFKTVDEAIKSNAEGFEFLMSHGVIPRPITWCIEPGSALAGHPMIPLEYYIRLNRVWWETWRKYELPPVWYYGHFGTGRGRYNNGAYTDMPVDER